SSAKRPAVSVSSRMCAVVGVMFLRTHFVRKSAASDMTTLLDATVQQLCPPLSNNLRRASDVIKSSCPSSVPLTPIGRLDASEHRLDATIKAIQIIRSPLERFYEALSDEQRQRFDAMNGSTRGAPSAVGSTRGAPSTGNMVAACSQGAGNFIDLP